MTRSRPAPAWRHSRAAPLRLLKALPLQSAGTTQTIEQHAQDNSGAIGDHIPRREDAAEQQRARQRQPKSIKPGGMHQPEKFDADGDHRRDQGDAPRGRRRPAILAKILVRKKTMVAHRIEPPYFTIEAGKPAPNPNLRKARPAATIARHSQTRTIVGGHRSPCVIDRDVIHGDDRAWCQLGGTFKKI